MKKTILFLFFGVALYCLQSCNSEEKQGQQLPAETQIGANTFGCLINNKVFVPRGGTPGNSLNTPFINWGDPTGNNQYNEFDVCDFESYRTASILIHIHNLPQIGVGDYVINESNGQKDIDGFQHTNLYCRVFDTKTNRYQYYRSYENSGLLKITKVEHVSGVKSIISGNFSCKVRNSINPADEISITDGRFDIDKLTIGNKIFP